VQATFILKLTLIHFNILFIEQSHEQIENNNSAESGRGFGMKVQKERRMLLDKIVLVKVCITLYIEGCGGGREASLCGLMDR